MKKTIRNQQGAANSCISKLKVDTFSVSTFSLLMQTAKKTKVFNMYPGTEEEMKIRFQNRAADVVVDEFGEQVNMMCHKK